jgi:tetratricopeptide (TPR) repeat protein
MDIDSLWEYSDPAASEARFREALDSTRGDERLELLTQIARTHSLRQNFIQANAVLDEIESQLDSAGARPRVRTLLERGRVFNSAGEKDRARPLFVEAWEQAQAAHEDGLAVDAAHMVAITYSGTPESLVWNQRGLTLARASQDPKAYSMLPALLNNMAWDLHDLGRFNDALAIFEDAHDEWAARSRPAQTRIAKWSVARCLRSLERYEEALALQRELESEHQADGSADRYVFEEIAENLTALGKPDQARPYFQKAAAMQGQDE